MEKGHRVAEIRVVGIRNVRNSSIPITLPDGTGYEHLVGKKKKVQNNQVNLVLRDNELCNMTRVFTRHCELDTFIEFLQTNESLKNLTFHVDLLTLENEETKEVGRWERCRAKDGTNRMVLELKKINGKKYTEFMYSQILAYSDGMADAECRKIPKPKAKPKDDTVCYFAAKDGAFDG